MGARGLGDGPDPQTRAMLTALRTHQPDRVVSTGATIALPHMLATRLRGIPVTSVEGATRLQVEAVRLSKASGSSQRRVKKR